MIELLVKHAASVCRYIRACVEFGEAVALK